MEDTTPFPRTADPVITSSPMSLVEAPRVTSINQEALPVWKGAKIRKVGLAPYVNEKGEAFLPSEKLVVEEGPGWNMDALKNPHLAYIPTDNIKPIPSAYGHQYGHSAVTPKSDDPRASSRLYSMENVRVTGYVLKSEELQARAMASPTEVPVYDSALGWVLVPQTTLGSEGVTPSIPGPSNQQPQAPASNVPAVGSGDIVP